MDLESRLKGYIKEIPYEGQEVDTLGQEVFVENLLRKMLTFAHTFEYDTRGYHKDGRYYTKDQIVQMFLNQII